MSRSFFAFRARDGVSITSLDDGALAVEGFAARITFRATSLAPAVLDQLRALDSPKKDQEGELALRYESLATWIDRVNREDVALLLHSLARLADRNLLTASLIVVDDTDDDDADERKQKPVATLECAPSSLLLLAEEPAVNNLITAAVTTVVLSRFAHMRVENGAWIVESPHSRARVLVHDARVMPILHALAHPTRIEELLRSTIPQPLLLQRLPAESIAQLLALLHGASLLRDANRPEDRELATWEHHDLIFHARTRDGRHDYPVGPTFRFVDRADRADRADYRASSDLAFPPPPAIVARARGATVAAGNETVVFPKPDLEALASTDPPFHRVYDARASIRTYDNENPITKAQLGELLYRVARVRSSEELIMKTPSGVAVPMSFIKRPFPTAGRLHEIEVYVVINKCADLDDDRDGRGRPRALYRYDGLLHQLDLVCDVDAQVMPLLGHAHNAAGMPLDDLQVLLILAARFDRIAWEYSSIAYSLLLKNVGVLYQSLYLVATAMGLAPCALGCGDADRFASAAATDYYAMTSVGEFLVGSKPRA